MPQWYLYRLVPWTAMVAARGLPRLAIPSARPVIRASASVISLRAGIVSAASWKPCMSQLRCGSRKMNNAGNHGHVDFKVVADSGEAYAYLRIVIDRNHVRRAIIYPPARIPFLTVLQLIPLALI
jgi:hypothetical protein